MSATVTMSRSDARVGGDASVAHAHTPARLARNFLIVRGHDDRDVVGRAQFDEQRHHLGRALRVEVAGGLVGVYSRLSESARLGTTKDARKIGRILFPVHRKATVSPSVASRV
jgi:hypothetical protein